MARGDGGWKTEKRGQREIMDGKERWKKKGGEREREMDGKTRDLTVKSDHHKSKILTHLSATKRRSSSLAK